MQRHQLNLIQFLVAFAAFHHVAQGKARHHLGQRHWLIQLAAFEHFRHPAEQGIDVFHAHFGGFRAG
ncbi:hypothetical protein D3C78_1436260 [compost metagenome]